MSGKLTKYPAPSFPNTAGYTCFAFIIKPTPARLEKTPASHPHPKHTGRVSKSQHRASFPLSPRPPPSYPRHGRPRYRRRRPQIPHIAPASRPTPGPPAKTPGGRAWHGGRSCHRSPRPAAG